VIVKAIAVAAAVMVLAFFAAAGSARADDTEKAVRLFSEGRALLEQKNVQGAYEKFSEAERLAPKGAGILINLALCEEQLGKPASAYEHFERAVAVLDAADDRRTFAADHASALRARIAMLTIVLAPTAPRSVEVRRDGRPLPTSGLGRPEAVEPGVHVIDVHAAGRSDRRVEVTLRAGEATSVQADAGEVAAVPGTDASAGAPSQANAPTPASDVQSAPSTSTRTALTLGLGGIALAGLGVGAYFEASGWSKRAGLDACNGSCAQDSIDDARRTMLVGDVFLGASAVLAAATAYLYFTRPGSGSSSSLGTLPVAVSVGPRPGGIVTAATWDY
jgi:tetratricopeptide (TPR) repeat protein